MGELLACSCNLRATRLGFLLSFLLAATVSATGPAMVATKKAKKTHEGINNRLSLVMKSGKYTLGYKAVVRTLRNSKIMWTWVQHVASTSESVVSALSIQVTDIIKSMPGEQ